MVRELFHVEPDAWQAEVLEVFPHRPLIAMACCKGPGKTATIAWLCWNFLLTREHSKIGATSITGDNLRDNLWAEMAKWRARSPLIQNSFEWQATRISHKERPENWFMAFRTWPRTGSSEELGQTLAGFWGDSVMLVIDEAGGVPVPVLRAAEVISAQYGTKGREAHVLLAGNCTSVEGALYDAIIDQRDRYYPVEVTADPDDAKRTPRIPLEFAREQIARYGRDDPWVMINILGRFPKRGLNQLISAEEVKEAQRRTALEAAYAPFPRIMGIDPAEFGDDETVFFIRQGNVAFPPLRMRNLDAVQVGAHAARIANERKIDSIQVDATGVGWGVWSWLHSAAYGHALAVKPGSEAGNKVAHANLRAECWCKLAQAIKDGLVLPPVPEMVKGLSAMTYSYNNRGQILLERKEDYKARIGRSPDLEDALSYTWAFPVHAMPKYLPGVVDLDALRGGSHHEYDPYLRYAQEVGEAASPQELRQPS